MRSSPIGFGILGIVVVILVGIVAIVNYQHQSDRCKAMGGHVVTVTSYGTTYVPGGYVNGKYVSGGNVSSSSTTTNCLDKNGVILFGM